MKDFVEITFNPIKGLESVRVNLINHRPIGQVKYELF